MYKMYTACWFVIMSLHNLFIPMLGAGQRWTGSFHLRHLCPLTLHLTFPPGYPSSDPPAFALSCVWLRKTQISTLCKQLDRLWEATPNMPIVFSWMDWLENETVR